jgi:hypothetical protein
MPLKCPEFPLCADESWLQPAERPASQETQPEEEVGAARVAEVEPTASLWKRIFRGEGPPMPCGVSGAREGEPGVEGEGGVGCSGAERSEELLLRRPLQLFVAEISRAEMAEAPGRAGLGLAPVPLKATPPAEGWAAAAVAVVVFESSFGFRFEPSSNPRLRRWPAVAVLVARRRTAGAI